MVLEERDYHIISGRMAEFIATDERLGVENRRRNSGISLAVSSAISTSSIMSWRSGYDSIADREERRARMLANPGWADYRAAIKGIIERQCIRVEKPTSIAPMQ